MSLLWKALLCSLTGVFVLIGCTDTFSLHQNSADPDQPDTAQIFSTASANRTQFLLDPESNHALDARRERPADSSAQRIPGTPHSIQIIPDVIHYQQVGGGAWEFPLGIRVLDRVGIPVQFPDPIAIQILLSPDTLATVIQSGSPQFISLRFQGSHAFDTLAVTARFGLLSTTSQIALPLFDGQLQLIVTPRVMYGTGLDRIVRRVTVQCRDGYGVFVTHAPIVMAAQHGLFFATIEDARVMPRGVNPVNPPRFQSNQEIWLGATLPSWEHRFTMPGEVFLDSTTHIQNSTISAQLLGYPAVRAQETITYQR